MTKKYSIRLSKDVLARTWDALAQQQGKPPKNVSDLVRTSLMASTALILGPTAFTQEPSSAAKAWAENPGDPSNPSINTQHSSLLTKFPSFRSGFQQALTTAHHLWSGGTEPSLKSSSHRNNLIWAIIIFNLQPTHPDLHLAETIINQFLVKSGSIYKPICPIDAYESQGSLNGFKLINPF